ncbi:MAG: YraN family protein [Planctomycetota bacterium]|nr:YraN family protein [Planctomycetota bacterium]
MRCLPLGAIRLLELEGEALGDAGERVVARALARRGWRLLGRRLATPAAEVDLVALDGPELVVVEVKTGRTGLEPGAFEAATTPRWRPGHRFRQEDLERTRRAAARIAARTSDRPWRVDLVELVLFPGGRARIYHHPGLTRPLPRPRRPGEALHLSL